MDWRSSKRGCKTCPWLVMIRPKRVSSAWSVRSLYVGVSLRQYPSLLRRLTNDSSLARSVAEHAPDYCSCKIIDMHLYYLWFHDRSDEIVQFIRQWSHLASHDAWTVVGLVATGGGWGLGRLAFVRLPVRASSSLHTCYFCWNRKRERSKQ